MEKEKPYQPTPDELREARSNMNKYQEKQSNERSALLEIREMESENKFNEYVWNEGILRIYNDIMNYDYADNLKKELKRLVEERDQWDKAPVSKGNMRGVQEKLIHVQSQINGVERLSGDIEIMQEGKDGNYKFELEDGEKISSIDYWEGYEDYRNFTRIHVTIVIENSEGEKRNLRLDFSDNYQSFLTDHNFRTNSPDKAIKLLKMKSIWEKRIKQLKELENTLSSVGINLDEPKIFE